jgi:hypothetical protein
MNVLIDAVSKVKMIPHGHWGGHVSFADVSRMPASVVMGSVPYVLYSYE